jgi:Methyltransferase domain
MKESANPKQMSPAKAKAHEAKQEKKRARAAKEAKRGKAAAKPAKSEARKGAEKSKGKSQAKVPFWRRKAVRGKLRALRRRWKYTRRGVRRVYNRRYRFTYKRTIHRVPSRDELPALLNARGLLGRGAEIGVKQGRYSDELLRNWRGSELVSIDPWLSADPDEYVDRSNVSQDRFNEFYEETRERLAGYGSRSTIWRMTSVEAAAKVPDHSFDFVYIDARHDYESVKEDVAAWCTKVRPGGILAGHDYVDGDLPEGEFYVKSAVDEFFGEREIPVHGTEGPSAVESFPTWIVAVPEGGISSTAPRADEEGVAARSVANQRADADRAGEGTPV